MEKIEKMQELEEWRKAFDESQEKCMKLEKKFKKLKKRKKHCHYGDIKEKKRINKKLKKTKARLEQEREYSAKCENEILKLRHELECVRNEMSYREDVNLLNRKIDFLNNDSKYQKYFLDILLQELFPKFIEKYGKMPVDAEYKVIEDVRQK